MITKEDVIWLVEKEDKHGVCSLVECHREYYGAEPYIKIDREIIKKEKAYNPSRMTRAMAGSNMDV